MSGYGRGDDGWYDDLPRVDVVIPDDARELDAEARAVRRELRRERRQTRLRRIFTARRWRRVAVSAPFAIAILVVLGLVMSTLGVLRPRPPDRLGALPLAEHPPAAPGTVGGLLPDGDVTIDGAHQDVRSLRPAVFALIPASCDCEPQLDTLFAQVRQYGLDLYLVGSPEIAEQLDDLVATVGNGTAIPVLDGSVLSGAYPSTGLAVVLVHADGVVHSVHADLDAGIQLEPELSLLSLPGAR